MNNNKKNTKAKTLSVIAIVVVLLGSGGYYWRSNSATAAKSVSATTTADTVTLDNGADDIDWASLPVKNVTLTNDELTITEAGTYVLSGSTTAGVTVKADDVNVRIALNNATIKSTTGAAITVLSAKNTDIQLIDGTTNVIEDAATRSDQTIDGAIYSADDLFFDGTGKLIITSKFADAIVSNDDLTIKSGTYVITSADDAIRGKDSVDIADGTFTITAAQDAIKATNVAEQAKGTVQIQNGTFTIDAGDDAIHAEEAMVIKNGMINIKTSNEGIEGSNVVIDGGTITLYADDDGINGVTSPFTPASITINGGKLNVTVGPGDTDAIDSNGDITITGGSITVTAPTSSFDYDGTAKMTGGTIIVNGTESSTIPQPTMGGGGARR